MSWFHKYNAGAMEGAVVDEIGEGKPCCGNLDKLT